MGIADDLATCKAQVEELLEKSRLLEADLRSANEFRSLLLTAIAHDIRTPLTVIMGFASLLERSDGDDKSRRVATQRIVSAAQTLHGRIEELFDVASIDFGGLAREEFDVRGPIRDAVRLADVAVEVPSDLPPVMGDESSARRVLFNLVKTCSHLSREARIRLGARVEGDAVIVDVAEESTSYSPDEIETLFERFLGLPGAPDSPESGVGLYVAKRLAEAQGGELLVVPGQAGGVTFVFTLPVARRFAPADGLR